MLILDLLLKALLIVNEDNLALGRNWNLLIYYAVKNSYSLMEKILNT